jgi:hypothetical protein
MFYGLAWLFLWLVHESRIFKGITLGAALPTQDMRNGNFARMGPIIDPATGQPFTNDQVPDTMIAPSQTQS